MEKSGNAVEADYAALDEQSRAGDEESRLEVARQLKGDSSVNARTILQRLGRDSSPRVRSAAQAVIQESGGARTTSTTMISTGETAPDWRSFLDVEVVTRILIPLGVLIVLGLFSPTIIPPVFFLLGFFYIILSLSVQFDRAIALPAAGIVILLAMGMHVTGLMINFRPTLTTMLLYCLAAVMVSLTVSKMRDERDVKEATVQSLRGQVAALKELVEKKKSQATMDTEMDMLDRMREELKVKSRHTLEMIVQLNTLLAERSSNKVIERMGKILRNQLGVSRFSIWFVDYSAREIYPMVSTDPQAVLEIVLPLVQHTLITRTAREGGSITLEEIEKGPDAEKYSPLQGFPTRLAIAMEGVDPDGAPRIVGVISVEDPEALERFSGEEKELLRSIARNGAFALSWSGDLELARNDLQNMKQMTENEKEEKKRIKQLFGKFVAPTVVEEILKHPEYIALGGRRRKITTFFADIRGFTAMSEMMVDRPETVIEIVNLFLSTMTNIIINKGGTLDKYMGDALMALFGAPVSRPDDAYRAVEAAVAIRRETQKIWEKLVKSKKLSVNVGIGINTGDAVVGMVGSHSMMNYTAIGDSVNTAARIEANAKAGQILISRDTWQEVKDYVQARELPPITVKGKTKPISIFEVEDLTDMFLI